jgi:hypothetical protein
MTNTCGLCAFMTALIWLSLTGFTSPLALRAYYIESVDVEAGGVAAWAI